MRTYQKLFNTDQITFSVQTKVLPTKGNLVYEYNPLRNYRLTQNMYEYKNQIYSKNQLQSKFGITMDDDEKNWIGVPQTETDPILRESGELVDFDTNEFKVSLDHPIHIIPQYSYDGSVNLIINDGINIPRLINSRFSATGKNTYEIVDRKGDNDTNIYDQGDQFDVDTSLYKRVTTIPKIEFKGVQSGGQLKVGNYHFYFRLSDADGNETDFVGESGLVSVFIGFNLYQSVHTGQKDENSHKQIVFQLSNIDSAYQYVTVYYSRYSTELSENVIPQYVKLDKKYVVTTSGLCNITITGNEPIQIISVSDVNLFYNTVDAVTTSAVCQNMLFLANVHKPDIPYTELADLSLRFLPYLHEEKYDSSIDVDYYSTTSSLGYIDAKYIYDKTGYWGEELYRLGVVYIMPDGTLSPVFNIRGAYQIPTYQIINEENTLVDSNFYSDHPVYKIAEGTTDVQERNYIQYDENTNYIINTDIKKRENVKGVVSFKPNTELDTIYGIDIRANHETISELKKYVKGYFFVRQPRIPTILAQGVTIGIDNVSRTPTIPTSESLLTNIDYNNTHVTTEDVNDVNYISEGFLSRYQFEFKEQENSFWEDFGKWMAIGTAIIAAAALTVFTMGAGAAVVTVVAVIAIGALAATAATVEAIDELATANQIRKGKPKRKLEGRNTEPVEGHDMVETSESRLLTDDFMKRVIIKDPSKNKVQAIVCPDYVVNQPFYNQIFTGNKHLIKTTKAQCANFLNGDSSNFFTNDGRHFFIPQYVEGNGVIEKQGYFNVVGVPDNTKAVGLSNLIFRSRAGEAEEAFRYEQVGDKFKEETWKINDDDDETSEVSLKKINSDIIRGAFGSYLAFDDDVNVFDPAETVNIYIPEYSIGNMNTYFDTRMQDVSSYYSISDRFDINEKSYGAGLVGQENYSKQHTLFRGDCYICQFTHRIIRNFNDPSAPYNDEIVDENSWKDNYDPDDSENNININTGDVNAVPLGMWLTFRVRSSNNLNIRTLDGSDINDTAMSGHPKGYYPYYPMSTEGTYKQPDSGIYNKGFAKSLSERWNVEVPDVPHIKNWFGTRIMYSDVHVNDAFKNGFRVFQGNNYRDYTREYGEIVKLVSLESNLLIIFEHGIGLATVNERAVAAQGAGGNVYINSANVLPENLFIISDMFGSQWAESILKVPGKTGSSAQWVYGVDTVAKKIWRTNGQTLECISDMRVQEFLNNNITLGERELTPKIGIRNVKTVYNAFKRDVLFTFYDNTYGFEEKVWNLCWNEILEKFITFYSWVPSYMENINNIPFSFNRDVSKWIAKLGTSHTESSIADGITLSNVITNNKTVMTGETGDTSLAVSNFSFPFTYTKKDGTECTIIKEVDEDSRDNFIGVLSLNNRTLPSQQLFYYIEYSLERDNYLNYKQFEIIPINVKDEYGQYVHDEVSYNSIVLPNDALYASQVVPTFALKFKSGKTAKGLSDEWQEVYYQEDDVWYEATDVDSNNVYTYKALYSVEALLTELYYRNSAGNAYADYDDHKVGPEYLDLTTDSTMVQIKDIPTLDGLIQQYSSTEGWESIKIGNAPYGDDEKPSRVPLPCTTLGKIKGLIDDVNAKQPKVHGIPLSYHWVLLEEQHASVANKVYYDLPIFKDITGKRKMLPRNLQLNPDKIVTLLNVRANIKILDTVNSKSLSDDYYNLKAGFAAGTSLIDGGYYESVVAIAPEWNLQFLGSDFWKHGQAGIIDIADDIYPTYWYGKQHPFEFECVVVNDPAVHKIFTNLELIANKAKPESFHYEIVGDVYDFAKDKNNMYFRQEAIKALWQYNGADICYDRNFLKIQPYKQVKSADFPHKYYTRQDTINEIEDYYIGFTSKNPDYRHLSGSEIVYYPNRQEYRIWTHARAVDIDDLPQDDARSIIAGNCRYLENKWRININPIVVCYKNEKYWTSPNRPMLPVMNSPIPDKAYSTIVGNNGEVEIPETLLDLGYTSADIDTSNWLNDVSIYGTSFGDAQNRREVDIRDKFVKIRIRYSGEELAIIDFLNTIYRISYA